MTPEAFGVDLLARVLDGAAFRHRVIAQNVANVNTPGYRRRVVVFEEELTRALQQQTNPDVRRIQPQVVIADGPRRVDGNTVDIDQEMNDLNRNTLFYQAVAQVLISRLASLRAAVAGR